MYFVLYLVSAQCFCCFVFFTTKEWRCSSFFSFRKGSSADTTTNWSSNHLLDHCAALLVMRATMIGGVPCYNDYRGVPCHFYQSLCLHSTAVMVAMACWASLSNCQWTRWVNYYFFNFDVNQLTTSSILISASWLAGVSRTWSVSQIYDPL